MDYTKNLYISLFYVSKKYRRLGIGSKLFDFAEEKRGNRDLIIGKDIDNFFPGVATDFDNLTDVWLEKRGFTGKRYTHDLISHNPYIFELKNKNIKYQYCTDDQKDELIEMIRKNNWGRWAVEADLYFKNKKEKDNDAYIVGMYDDKIVAFSRINTYNMDLSAYNVNRRRMFMSINEIFSMGCCIRMSMMDTTNPTPHERTNNRAVSCELLAPKAWEVIPLVPILKKPNNQ